MYRLLLINFNVDKNIFIFCLLSIPMDLVCDTFTHSVTHSIMLSTLFKGVFYTFLSFKGGNSLHFSFVIQVSSSFVLIRSK